MSVYIVVVAQVACLAKRNFSCVEHCVPSSFMAPYVCMRSNNLDHNGVRVWYHCNVIDYK